MKRVLLLLLVCAMFLLCFAGCGEKKGSFDPVTTTASQKAEGDTPGYDVDGYLLDDLPETLNFNNEDIKILHWTECDIINPGEDAKGVIEQACYTRNLRVEDRLGVNLQFIPAEGHGNAAQSFLAKVQTAMLGGEETRYDLISVYNQTAGMIATSGLSVNLYDVDYLNFQKPWWPRSVTESFTVGNKLYFASGDISEAFLAEMIAVLYNKDILGDVDLYGLVNSGEWTLEKMLELSKDRYADLDNSDSKNFQDRYGTVIPWDSYFDAFFYGSDLIVVDSDESGRLHVSPTYVGERSDDLAEMMKTFFYQSNDGLIGNSESIINLFAKGNSVFMVSPGAMILGTQSMHDTTMDYGIVPMPKYDADQKEYKTTISNLYSIFEIFAGCNREQANRAGAVMECMASEGYRTISPAVFEVCLKIRYANDLDSGKMYDLIREGVVFDIGRVFSMAALKEIPTTKWKRSVIDGKVWGAQSAAVDAQLQELLDQLYESFTEN